MAIFLKKMLQKLFLKGYIKLKPLWKSVWWMNQQVEILSIRSWRTNLCTFSLLSSIKILYKMISCKLITCPSGQQVQRYLINQVYITWLWLGHGQFMYSLPHNIYIDGLVQERHNSSNGVFLALTHLYDMVLHCHREVVILTALSSNASMIF